MTVAAPDINTPGPSVARPLGRNMAAILTSRSLTIALQFVAFGTLAARLGPSRLGVYAFGLSFATLFTLATDIGLRAMMTRESAQRPEQEAAIERPVAAARERPRGVDDRLSLSGASERSPAE